MADFACNGYSTYDLEYFCLQKTEKARQTLRKSFIAARYRSGIISDDRRIVCVYGGNGFMLKKRRKMKKLLLTLFALGMFFLTGCVVIGYTDKNVIKPFESTSFTK